MLRDIISILNKTPPTYLVPGDSVVKSIDCLVITRHRAVVGDVKLCIFLDHISGLPQDSTAACKLGHTQQEHGR